MTEPRYRWTHEPENRRYVIWRGDWVYQHIPINRHNPAHTPTFVQRCVDTLNGEQ